MQKNISLSAFAMLMIVRSALWRMSLYLLNEGPDALGFPYWEKFRIHRMHHMERMASFLSRAVKEIHK